MKKILLTISILALCLLCFVGCASFTDLNTPHKVTINVTRLSNVPSELKIDVTTTLGEITSSGDSHVIQAPRLKKFTVTVSAKGYKSRVITITPQELVEEKVIAVEFGATLSDEYSFSLSNTEELEGLTITPIGDGNKLTATLVDKEIVIKDPDIYSPIRDFTISAKGYEPITTNVKDLLGGSPILLTKTGTALVKIIDEFGYSARVTDEFFNEYLPFKVGAYRYITVPRTDTYLFISFNNETTNVYARDLPIYGATYPSSPSDTSTKRITFDYFDQSYSVYYINDMNKFAYAYVHMYNKTDYCEVPSKTTKIFIKQNNNNHMANFDVSTATSIDCANANFLPTPYNYKIYDTLNREFIKDFYLTDHDGTKISSVNGVITGYYDNNCNIDEQNSVRLNSDPARGGVLESDGSITMLCEFSRSINIKFQILKADNTPFVGEVFYLNDSPLPYANSYYTLTTQYSAEQILVQLRCGSFDLIEYVIISSSDTLTKNIDGSYTYNRPLHLQATQNIKVIFMDGESAVSPDISVLGEGEYIIRHGVTTNEKYHIFDVKNGAIAFTATHNGEATTYNIDTTNISPTGYLYIDLRKQTVTQLFNVSIRYYNGIVESFQSSQSFTITQSNGITLIRDNSLYVQQAIEFNFTSIFIYASCHVKITDAATQGHILIDQKGAATFL